MLNRLKLLTGLVLMTTSAAASADMVKVDMQTSAGTIVLALDADKAPATVANFVEYANDGFYDGTVFHRVIEGFMIQGGGHTESLAKKETRAPIQNEANNGLSNVRGSIAMARTNDPHSATAQFFINHGDNGRLDFRSETSYGYGYTVFGQVVEGMDVVDKIAEMPTGAQGPFRSDVPQPLVVIESVRIVDSE